jgi:hypothetical protein
MLRWYLEEPLNEDKRKTSGVAQLQWRPRLK